MKRYFFALLVLFYFVSPYQGSAVVAFELPEIQIPVKELPNQGTLSLPTLAPIEGMQIPSIPPINAIQDIPLPTVSVPQTVLPEVGEGLFGMASNVISTIGAIAQKTLTDVLQNALGSIFASIQRSIMDMVQSIISQVGPVVVVGVVVLTGVLLFFIFKKIITNIF